MYICLEAYFGEPWAPREICIISDISYRITRVFNETLDLFNEKLSYGILEVRPPLQLGS